MVATPAVPAPEEHGLAVSAGRRARAQARHRRARRLRFGHHHSLGRPRRGRLHGQHRRGVNALLAVPAVAVHRTLEVPLGGEHVELAVGVRAPPAAHTLRPRHMAGVDVPADVKVRREEAVPAPPHHRLLEGDHLATTIS
uniref:Uncharacterized protein n=1 Tax=Arundo donax TaxID=35708 RepID=A0A0A9BDD8_ARUDO